MAALVQTLPVQTTSVTMTGRPSSSGGYSSQNPQGQMRSHQPSRYNNMSPTGYRGVSSGGPVAPYAFTQTPQLTNTSVNPRQFTLESGRSASAPKVPQTQSGALSRSQPSSPSSLPQVDAGNRPLSLGLPDIPSTGSLMDPSPTLSPPLSSTTAKPSPDRYRRNTRRVEPEGSQKSVSAGSGSTPGSGTAVHGSIYSHPNQSSSTPSLNSQQSFHGQYHEAATVPQNSSADDLRLGRAQSELAARYRRRSLVSIETAGVNHSSDTQNTSSPHPNVFIPTPVSAPSNSAAGIAADRPSYHKHTPSSDSVASSRSTGSSRPSSVSILPPCKTCLTLF